MATTYYWAAFQGSPPTRVPDEDGPQHPSLAAAVRARSADTSSGHDYYLRALRDGEDGPATEAELEALQAEVEALLAAVRKGTGWPN